MGAVGAGWAWLMAALNREAAIVPALIPPCCGGIGEGVWVRVESRYTFKGAYGGTGDGMVHTCRVHVDVHTLASLGYGMVAYVVVVHVPWLGAEHVASHRAWQQTRYGQG